MTNYFCLVSVEGQNIAEQTFGPYKLMRRCPFIYFESPFLEAPLHQIYTNFC